MDWWFENSIWSERWGNHYVWCLSGTQLLWRPQRETLCVYCLFLIVHVWLLMQSRCWRNLLDWLHCNIALPCNLTCDKYSLLILIRIHLIHSYIWEVKVRCRSGSGPPEGALKANMYISKTADPASYQICRVALSNKGSKYLLIPGLNHTELQPTNFSNLIRHDNKRQGS